jgi:sporulation protein YlmC with PRC-barrel domain
MAERRRLSLVRDVLELQVLDREARPIGRVDDLEVTDTGEVVALIVGGTALARRLGGPLGSLWASTFRRLADDRGRDATRIPLEHVLRVDSRVDLDVDRHDLGIGRLDEWLNARIIERIPEHDYAPE